MLNSDFNWADQTISQFIQNPEDFDFSVVSFVLGRFGFEEISFSPKIYRFKHIEFDDDFVIFVHNNDCNLIYKKLAVKLIQEYFL